MESIDPRIEYVDSQATRILPMKPTKYKIVQGDTNDTANQVNFLLSEGWELWGNLTVDRFDNYCYQTMVKYG